MYYLTPNEDNEAQCAKMNEMGIFTSVKEEIGQLMVATVGRDQVTELATSDIVMEKLIGGVGAA